MRKGLTILFFLLSAVAVAQDAHFTQPHFGSTRNNPAFVGANGGSNALMVYRNQWPGLTANFQNLLATVDHTFGDSRSALGVSYLHTDEARGVITTDRFTVNHAYTIPILGTVMVRPALQMSYFQKALDWGRLSFGDQIDPKKGFIYQTNDTPRGGSVSNVDLSAGLLVYTRSLLIGISVYQFTTPNESFIGGGFSWPMRMSFQLGYSYDLDRTDLSLNPYLLHSRQGNFRITLPGVRVRYKRYFLGAGYRVGDAVTFSGGMSWKDFRIGYSYDLTISGLSEYHPGGAHEVGLSYQFLSRETPENLVPVEFNLY